MSLSLQSLPTRPHKSKGLLRLTVCCLLLVLSVAALQHQHQASADEISDAGSHCLVAGTLVSSENGTRAIETLNDNDLIWVEDETHGQVELRAVTGRTERQVAGTLLLTFSNGEQVETTSDHAFYVEGIGFKSAGQLALDNSIVTKVGPSLAITAITQKSQTKLVYSLSVAEFNTYFVGASGFWVRN